MSGGHFEYKQYLFREFADTVERELNKQGKDKDKEVLWGSDDYYKAYPQDLKYPTYSVNIQKRFREAIAIFKIAEIYATRIDWLLSGDDGEETFIERLLQELKDVKTD